MSVVVSILKWLLIALLAVIIGGLSWLYLYPPALIRVGTGYAAKIVCSNHFVAGRDAGQVLKVDVQAPGHPLLGFVSATVDEEARIVSSSLLGVFGTSHALARDGFGCTSVPDGEIDAARRMALSVAESEPAPVQDMLWPEGARVEPSQDAAVSAILDNPDMTGPGMRAVVVVSNGRIVGERYGEGFSADTPLLGWSMTKTVTAAIIGTLVRDGRLALDQDDLFELWSTDDRSAITIANLLAMSSGLAFNEDYGDVTDVTRMLYLEPDMAGFAAAKELVAAPGRAFSYSSGTTLMLSRIWQDSFDDPAEALAWPRQALFSPLGMRSAVFEADARGTFAGSSYLYASGRDWARFGQFLLQDGVWQGTRILPEGFVAMMREPAPASGGVYGKGHLWLRGPGGDAGEKAGAGLPDDTFWLRGHDGQTVAVIPSRDLVVVRLGLTPSKLAYRPQAMVAALAAVLP